MTETRDERITRIWNDVLTDLGIECSPLLAALELGRRLLAEVAKVEPVKYMDMDGVTVDAAYWKNSDDRTKEWYSIPLYASAPPEVVRDAELQARLADAERRADSNAGEAIRFEAERREHDALKRSILDGSHPNLVLERKARKIAELKNKGTLANNLCPDHSDKQVGLPCLACTIEKAGAKLARVEADTIERCAKVCDDAADEIEMFNDYLAGCKHEAESLTIKLRALQQNAAQVQVGTEPVKDVPERTTPAPAAAPDTFLSDLSAFLDKVVAQAEYMKWNIGTLRTVIEQQGLPTIGPGAMLDLHEEYERRIKEARINALEWAERSCIGLRRSGSTMTPWDHCAYAIATERARLQRGGCKVISTTEKKIA